MSHEASGTDPRPQAGALSADPAGPRSEVAGPQAEVSATPRVTPASTPAVLDDAQRALLRSALNRIVPARVELAGAGDLEVGMSIERTLAASSRLRRLFLEGLAEIAITSQRQAGSEFVDLPAHTQTAVLETVEQRLPAFFVALVEHTYRGYYTLAAVQATIGFDTRPPQPLGHQLQPFDPSLLARQRERAPFWRAAR